MYFDVGYVLVWAETLKALVSSVFSPAKKRLASGPIMTKDLYLPGAAH